MSIATKRSNPGKKWVDIFEERVEYKLQTKTFRISNQKFDVRHHKPKSPSKNGSVDEGGLTLPPTSSMSISSRVTSPKIFREDSISVLSEPSFAESPTRSALIENARKQYLLKECKHTAENLIPPPKQLDWDPSWGSQLLCYVCCEPAINDCMICKKCNMVAHFLCVTQANKILEANTPFLPPIKLGSIRQSFGRAYKETEQSHKCPNCEETLRADLKYYENLILRLKEERQKELSASLIGYRAMIFVYRCRLQKKKKMIIRIQAKFRGILTRKKLLTTLLAKQQKIVVLQVLSLPNFITSKELCNNSTGQPEALVIVSIHDTFKNVQVFRFDKPVESVFNEMILLPGISLYHTLLVTLAVRDPTTNVYTLVGQAQLSIRDITKRTRRSELNISFLERITWIPQEVPGIKSPIFTVPYRILPYYSEMNDFFVRLRYSPQNPVTSFCNMISAPPLDILKRAAEVGVKKTRRAPTASQSTTSISNTAIPNAPGGSSSGNYRNSRYWICLHQLKLWFYQYYGDAAPRFASDVKDCACVVMLDKGHPTSLVTLIHNDQRTWVLEFPSRQEATKFEVALNESKKAVFESRSIYAKREELLENYYFGFGLPLY